MPWPYPDGGWGISHAVWILPIARALQHDSHWVLCYAGGWRACKIMTNTQVMGKIQEFLAKHNPCGFHKVDGVVKCEGKHNNYTPCCHGCRHLGANGCGLSRPNMCRMFLCPSAWRRLSNDQQSTFTALCQAYSGPLYFRESANSAARIPEKKRGWGYVHTGGDYSHRKPPFVW